jgi:hypothetical protein
MEQSRIIETIGSITKMEQVCALDSKILDNTLVLQNIRPFPGLQKENALRSKHLGSFFIILRYRYAPEKINKINFDLFKEASLKRYPSYGEIITPENIFPCIRLKEIEASEIIAIQEYFKGRDLQLMVHKAFDQLCRIKIFKTFRLVEMADGLYRDLTDGEKFYIQINTDLNWKRFDYLVKKIKFNLEIPEFDAALGVIYRFCGPQNVIRIFDQNKSLERAMNLKKWFLSEIKKEINISTMH